MVTELETMGPLPMYRPPDVVKFRLFNFIIVTSMFLVEVMGSSGVVWDILEHDMTVHEAR